MPFLQFGKIINPPKEGLLMARELRCADLMPGCNFVAGRVIRGPRRGASGPCPGTKKAIAVPNVKECTGISQIGLPPTHPGEARHVIDGPADFVVLTG